MAPGVTHWGKVSTLLGVHMETVVEKATVSLIDLGELIYNFVTPVVVVVVVVVVVEFVVSSES